MGKAGATLASPGSHDRPHAGSQRAAPPQGPPAGHRRQLPRAGAAHAGGGFGATAPRMRGDVAGTPALGRFRGTSSPTLDEKQNVYNKRQIMSSPAPRRSDIKFWEVPSERGLRGLHAEKPAGTYVRTDKGPRRARTGQPSPLACPCRGGAGAWGPPCPPKCCPAAPCSAADTADVHFLPLGAEGDPGSAARTADAAAKPAAGTLRDVTTARTCCIPCPDGRDGTGHAGHAPRTAARVRSPGRELPVTDQAPHGAQAAPRSHACSFRKQTPLSTGSGGTGRLQHEEAGVPECSSQSTA